MEKYRVKEPKAAKIAEWMRERGGIAIWKSINLSNPGMSLTTPRLDPEGRDYPKPSWEVESAPSRVITDMDEVEVAAAELVTQFHVAVRMGSQGLALKLTDGASRRLRKAVAKAGEGAWYEFNYGNYDNALVFRPGRIVPLKQWIVEQSEDDA